VTPSLLDLETDGLCICLMTDLFCAFCWRQSAELSLRSFIAVFSSPGLDHASGVFDRSTQMVVQAIVLKSAVEAFAVCFLVCFALIDLPKVNVPIIRPVGDVLADELRSGITANDLW
jgi:hypothetical protein